MLSKLEWYLFLDLMLNNNIFRWVFSNVLSKYCLLKPLILFSSNFKEIYFPLKWKRNINRNFNLSHTFCNNCPVKFSYADCKTTLQFLISIWKTNNCRKYYETNCVFSKNYLELFIIVASHPFFGVISYIIQNWTSYLAYCSPFCTLKIYFCH